MDALCGALDPGAAREGVPSDAVVPEHLCGSALGPQAEELELPGAVGSRRAALTVERAACRVGAYVRDVPGVADDLDVRSDGGHEVPPTYWAMGLVRRWSASTSPA